MHKFKKLLLAAPLLAASYSASAQLPNLVNIVPGVGIVSILLSPSALSGLSNLSSSSSLAGLTSVTDLLTITKSPLVSGGLSLNNLPIAGSLLGAPGAPSIAITNLPILSSLATASTGIFPSLGGLPNVNAIPLLPALLGGGTGGISLGALPGIGAVLFGGAGGNVLSLNGLTNGGLQSVVKDILPTSGSAGLNLAGLLPVQGGILGQNSLLPPSLLSIFSAYNIPFLSTL